MNNAKKIICILFGTIASLHSSQNWQDKILGGTSFDQVLIKVLPHVKPGSFCIRQVLVADCFSREDFLKLYQDHKANKWPNNYITLLAKVGSDSQTCEMLNDIAFVTNNFVGHFKEAEEPLFVAQFRSNIIAALLPKAD